MIHIFHGDNVAASRSAYVAKKVEHAIIRTLRGSEITLTELMQELDGGGLFQDKQHIALEELFTAVNDVNLIETVSSYLNTKQKHVILLWEGHTLSKTKLALFPKADIHLFKLPRALFTFLDSLRPRNASLLLKLSQAVKKEAGDEVLFSMLLRQIRLLLAIRARADIDLVTRLAPWQRAKAEKQASTFSLEKLIALHRKLTTIDVERKTGKTKLPLAIQIDFFLLGI